MEKWRCYICRLASTIINLKTFYEKKLWLFQMFYKFVYFLKFVNMFEFVLFKKITYTKNHINIRFLYDNYINL